MGWLTGYAFRKSHIINAATGAGTNYQVGIKVYHGAGTDGTETVDGETMGKVYLSGNGEGTSFEDVRFTDDDGSTELKYWRKDHVDDNYAVFWVKVADSLESANQTIYVYYGKADDSTTSNPDDTLIYFHDFEGETVGQPPTKFLETTYLTVQADTVEGIRCVQFADAGTDVKDRMNMVDNAGVCFNAKMKNSGNLQASFGVRYVDASNYIHVGGIYGNPANFWGVGQLVGGVWTDTHTAFTWGSGWHDVECKIYSSSVTAKIDTTSVTKSDLTMLSAGKGFLLTWNSVTAWFDYIRIRKYCSPEPAHSTWGIEEPYIQEDVTKTYSIDEVIKQLNASKDYSIDVVTKSSGVTKTYNIDEIIKQLSVTKSFDVDTALREIDVLVQYLTDEVIKQLSASKTYDIDEIIKQINTVKNYSIDEVIKLISSKSYDVDTIMKRMNDSITYNVDLILKRNGIMNSYFIDLLVKKINTAIQYQIDVFLNIPSHTSQYDIDLALMKVQVSNYVVDVMLHGSVECSSSYLLDLLLGGEFGGLAYYIYSLRERLCLMKSDIRIPIKMPFLLMESSIEWTEDVLEKLLDVNSDIFLVNIHNILSEVEGDILYKISIHDWLTVMCSVKPSKKKQIERLKRIETE